MGAARLRQLRKEAERRIEHRKWRASRELKSHKYLLDLAGDGKFDYLRDSVMASPFPYDGMYVENLLTYGFVCGRAAALKEGKNEVD